MKRIAVIHDLSGLGKCSLTAAIPVISVMGVQACPFPTAILSNQTGYASYYCDEYTDRMDIMMEEWEKRKFDPDGIYTGYLSDEQQVDKILEFIRRFSEKKTKILVDPVMGDQGKIYAMYTQKLCEKMGLLIQKADVITPNLTEAMLLLYGEEKMYQEWEKLQGKSDAEYAVCVERMAVELQKRNPSCSIVITGVDRKEKNGREQIGNLLCRENEQKWYFADKLGGSYSGTGDLFASVLSADMVKGIPLEISVKKAMYFLSDAIRDTVKEGCDRNDGVCFETYLFKLAEDSYE